MATALSIASSGASAATGHADGSSGGSDAVRNLRYHPAPVDNPLKGFVPFRGDYGEDAFPHSLEWAYFPVAELMSAPGQFDFEATLEPALEEIAARRHQAALRFYLDYPTKPSGVPSFLIEGGLKMTAYSEHGGGLSPDYGDENLLTALEEFIAALGKRYDKDPRVAYLTLGLLGFWGEWHTFPHDDWFPDRSIQERVLRAYTKAFTKTQLLMRYPQPQPQNWPIGLHDDSFAHSTLGPDAWQFLPRIEANGASELWRRHVIGGEVRPEIQSLIWGPESATEKDGYQDFDECVRRTHASWLINQDLFRNFPTLSGAEKQRAMEGARRLGYELHVSSASFPRRLDSRAPFELKVNIENRGAAPFYHDWPIKLEFGQHTMATEWRLSQVMPGDGANAATWKTRITLPRPLPAGVHMVRLRAEHPLPDGLPLRFANAEQKADGWLELGSLQVP